MNAIFLLGPVGTDNVACPVTCPQAPCPKEMVGCPQTSSNGCTMPELCMPATTGCPTPAPWSNL